MDHRAIDLPQDMTRQTVAVTGATGFIGQHLVAALHAAGWHTRLLLRQQLNNSMWRDLRPQVVLGSLEDEASLARLVDGVDAVIHVAGLIKAARRRDFFAINLDATAKLARTAERLAPRAHFLHLSSLAAREPSLSDYAASKRAGEEAVLDILGSRTTVLRPPAVYGPGDRETLRIFKLARQRLVPVLGTPDAVVAMIHVQDLTRLILSLIAAQPRGEVLTAADGMPAGYHWRELLAAAAQAVGNPSPRFVDAPQSLLGVAALLGDLARAVGTASMLSTQKLRELRHADWGVAPSELARPAGWEAQFDLHRGFADAVAWYRSAGWLPS